MMEEHSSSETSVLIRATRRNIPEDVLLLNIIITYGMPEFWKTAPKWMRVKTDYLCAKVRRGVAYLLPSKFANSGTLKCSDSKLTLEY
jgi:hypothetical protein